MSTLHLFERNAGATRTATVVFKEACRVAAIAAVCLVASGGLVAARHNARNSEPP